VAQSDAKAVQVNKKTVIPVIPFLAGIGGPIGKYREIMPVQRKALTL
jgi:hypothetical protein